MAVFERDLGFGDSPLLMKSLMINFGRLFLKGICDYAVVGYILK